MAALWPDASPTEADYLNQGRQLRPLPTPNAVIPIGPGTPPPPARGTARLGRFGNVLGGGSSVIATPEPPPPPAPKYSETNLPPGLDVDLGKLAAETIIGALPDKYTGPETEGMRPDFEGVGGGGSSTAPAGTNTVAQKAKTNEITFAKAGGGGGDRLGPVPDWASPPPAPAFSPTMQGGKRVYTNADLDQVHEGGHVGMLPPGSPSMFGSVRGTPGGVSTFSNPQSDLEAQQQELASLQVGSEIAKARALAADPLGEGALSRKLALQQQFDKSGEAQTQARNQAAVQKYIQAQAGIRAYGQQTGRTPEEIEAALASNKEEFEQTMAATNPGTGGYRPPRAY